MQSAQSAVIVPVPEAEGVLGRIRADLDPAAAVGVPAHVTVIAPFIPTEQIDHAVLGALAAAIASVPAFDVTLADVRWFGDGVLWLAPDPAGPFRALTQALWQRFPACPPYGGAYDDVVPHLTVGLGPPAQPLLAAARDLLPLLPIRARVTAAQLFQTGPGQESWHPVADFPLGSA